MKLTELFESLAGNPKLPRPKRRGLLGLLEEDGMIPDVDAEPPAEGADPDAALKEGFKQAAQGLFDAALDGDGEALKKLTKLIQAHVKLSGGAGAGDVEEADEEEDADDEGTQEGKKPKKGRGKQPLTEADARGMCELAGVEAKPGTLALMTGKSLTEARAVLELAKGQAGGGKASDTPVAFGPGRAAKPIQESRQQQAGAANPDEARAARVAALRGGR